MVRGISAVLSKNFKIIFTNKIYYVILIFVPIILLGILGGVYFDKQEYNLNVGVIIKSKTQLYNYFYEDLKNYSFNVSEFENQTQCYDKIKNSEINVCLLFPDNFQIQKDKKIKINVTIDSTKRNIFPIIKNHFLKIFDGQNSKLKQEFLIDLVDFIYLTKNKQNEILQKTNVNKQKIQELIIKLEENKKSLSSLEGDIDILVYSTSNLKNEPKKLSKKNLLENVSNIHKNILSLETEIGSTTSNVTQKISDLKEYTKKLNSSISDSVSIEEKMNEINMQAISMKNRVKRITNTFDDMIKKVNEIKQNLEQNSKIGNVILNEEKKLEVVDVSILSNPIDFEIISSNEKDTKNHLNSLFPTLLVGVICFLSILLSSNLAYLDKKNNAHFRNVLSELSSLTFLLGDLLSLFLVVFIQSIFIIFFYNYFFLGVLSLSPLLLILIIPMILFFIIVGLFIGEISKNSFSNYSLSFFIIFVFLTFSGKILPLELLPENFITIIKNFNPYFLSEQIVRKVFFFQETFNSLKIEIFKILIFFFSSFLILLFVESFILRRKVYYLFLRIKYLFFKKN